MLDVKSENFKLTATLLRDMVNAAGPDSPKLVQVLVDALDITKRAIVGRVHSVTGKTVKAITVAAGKSLRGPSAYVKIDRNIASVLWAKKKGADKTPFPYPFAVEYGHGGPHPAPPHAFFKDGVDDSKSEVRDAVREGIADILFPGSSQVGSEFL